MPRIKELLARGEFVRLFGVGQLFSPKLIEIVGEHGGFDGLWLDAEHGGLTMKEVEIATLAAKAYGMDHFVRMPANDYASIMRVLEAGAGGVMVSMVKSPEDAEQAVSWAKFWPRGARGLNGGNRDGRVWPDAHRRIRCASECTNLRGHSDRDGRRDRCCRGDRQGS
jgi:2-dehydro-3-deoxyglucarate aldolase/4-hydroxy-2-oxoheptanedioate aldolase